MAIIYGGIDALKRKSKKHPKRDKKKSAAVVDPEGERPLSFKLVLPVTTPSDSESPLTTPTSSLIIFDTILGILFSFSSQTHNYSTFHWQVTVRMKQSSTKVHFKAEPSPSNVSNNISYP
jgi:hypothetical protein